MARHEFPPGRMGRGPGPDRRTLLAGLASLPLVALIPSPLFALGDASRFDVAELDMGGGTLRRSQAWIRLLYEVVQTTSVETIPRTVILDPADPALFDHPFAVLVGNGNMDPLSEAAAAQLSRYLQYGGFLFIDDTSGVVESAFDRSVRNICSRLFPTRSLAPLPADHSVFRAFFLIGRPVGRIDLVPYLEGITLGETTPLVYCRNDLSGALDRGQDGRDLYPVVPGGSDQRREALKLGINLVMYSLTSNYKKDIAHVRRLMMDGRLE